MSDHQWTSRVTSWTAFVEHADGTRLQPVSSRVGETDEDVARRVAAALNGTADLGEGDFHNPEGALSFLRYGIDETPDQRVRDAAYETLKEALRRWRSIDLTEVSAAVSEYLRAITLGGEASESRTALYAVLDAARALVASTGTETDDAQ